MEVKIKDLRHPNKGRALALLLIRDELRELGRQCADRADLTSLDQPNFEMRMQTRLDKLEAQVERLYRSECGVQ